MAIDLTVLAPGAALLGAAVALDLALGDPVYKWHPVRLIGRTLSWLEGQLRNRGVDGHLGGIALFLLLAAIWIGTSAGVLIGASATTRWLGVAAHLFLLYSLLALGDLLHHVWRIESAIRTNDMTRARAAVSALVGRDTDRMDAGACRRAAVESLSENLTDGFVSPLFWYVLGGIPGIVLFKVVSTMDSMVGYKTPRYLQFGWCGARLDDVMNYLPARFTWIVVAVIAWLLPRYAGARAWRVGLAQHAVLPGPNSGWSEAAIAGALSRRIVGPIWMNGVLVTDRWIGMPDDPPLETANDVTRALLFVTMVGLSISAIACAVLLRFA